MVWNKQGNIYHQFNNIINGGVNQLVTNNKSILAIGRQSPDMKLLDIESNKITREFKGHEYRIFTMDAHLNDNVAVTSEGRYVIIWDVRVEKRMCVMHMHNPGFARYETLCLAKDLSNNNCLGTGDVNGDATLWDLRKVKTHYNTVEERIDASPFQIRTFSHSLSPICDMTLDTNRMVVGDKSGRITIWDLQGGNRTTSPTCIELNTKLWCFQSDDRALICGDRQGNITLLDFAYTNNSSLSLSSSSTITNLQESCSIQ